MKYTYLFFLFMLALSCKKSEAPAPTPSMLHQTFAGADIRFLSWTDGSANYVDSFGNGNALRITFNSKPTQSGQFKVVRSPAHNDEVMVYRYNILCDDFSVDSGGYYINVEISDGHYRFTSNDFVMYVPCTFSSSYYRHFKMDLNDR
jgi:hypothetical protein